jgi:integrase
LDKAEKTGATVRVNRVLSNLKRFFNWCVERGMIDASPAANVKPPVKEVARDRVLSEEEVAAFIKACEKMGEPFGRIMLLLLYTGQRRDEVSAARWSEFDLTARVWTLPADRVKNSRVHTLPLSSQVRTLVEGIVREQGNPYLFPARFSRTGSTDPRPVSGFTRAKERLDALMLEVLRETDPEAEMEPWRLHDLRRTAASGMARMGVGIHVVEKILNHVSGSLSGVAGVYNRHSYQDEMRAALQAWADWLDRPETIGTNVVNMRAATE